MSDKFRTYVQIHSENLSQDGQSPSLNMTPPEYETGELTTPLQSSVG
jgi:hypothetical protein